MVWILVLMLLSTVFTGMTSPTITANLKIVQYQPMVFELSFSQEISKPQFQLLLNHFQNIPYSFIGQTNNTQNYYLQVSSTPPQTSNLQMYQVVFNSPMTVGEGRLDLGSYNLEASKSPIRTEISTGYATFVMLMGYLLSNFTLLGNIILEYSQFYVLLMFKSQLSTTLYKDLSIGLLLIPNADTLATYPNSKRFIFECLAIPLLLIYVFGAAGYILKRCIKTKKSIKVNIVYDMFTYQAFLNLFIIFSPNLLFNSAQFISFTVNNSFSLGSMEKTIGSILVYFSLLTLIAISYMQIYVLNPKLKESSQSWNKYLQKSQFRAFNKLHQGINTSFWHTRNSSLIILLKKVLIIAVFFTGIFEYLLVYIQFASLYYLFTYRPYKQELYMNIYFIARLLAFIVYGIIVLGDIYFTLGSATFNYFPAKQFLIIRDAIFLAIVLVILGLVVRQIYQKIINLNYRFRLVREQNEFKLQILQKNDNSGAFQLKKQDDKQAMKAINQDGQITSNNRSDRHQSESKSKISQPNNDNQQHTLNIKRSHSLKKRKSHANLHDLDEDIFRNFSISADKSSNLKEKQIRSDKQTKIWKDESILQEMIKMK